MGLGTAVNISVLLASNPWWQVARRQLLVKWRPGGVITPDTGVLSGSGSVISADINGTVITLGTRWANPNSHIANILLRADDDTAIILGRKFGSDTVNFASVGAWPAYTVGGDLSYGNVLPFEPGSTILDDEFIIVTDGAVGGGFAKAIVVQINKTTKTVVSVGSWTDMVASGTILYNMTVIPRGSTNFEVYWNTHGAAGGTINCIYGTRTGTSLSFGSVHTVKANATRCIAAKVNATHTVVAFGDDSNTQNVSAILVNLQSGGITLGTVVNFAAGAERTGSIACASPEDDTFYILASVGTSFEVNTTDMRLYKGISNGSLGISSTEELADVSTGTGHTGKKMDLVVSDTGGDTQLVLSYARMDDGSEDVYLVAYEDEGVSMQVLGMSLSKGTGDRLYVTGHTGSELALKVYEYPALTELAAYSLGSATPAEVAARTYWAIPYAPFGIDDQLFVLGRLNDPGGLGLVHLIVSIDAGATFDVVENGLGTSHVGAAVETDTWDTYFVVNGAVSGCKLYQYDPTGDKVDLKSTIPVTGWCEPHGITPFGSNLIVGNGSADAKLVVYAAPPFANWFDLTFDHATANGLNAVVALP